MAGGSLKFGSEGRERLPRRREPFFLLARESGCRTRVRGFQGMSDMALGRTLRRNFVQTILTDELSNRVCGTCLTHVGTYVHTHVHTHVHTQVTSQLASKDEEICEANRKVGSHTHAHRKHACTATAFNKVDNPRHLSVTPRLASSDHMSNPAARSPTPDSHVQAYVPQAQVPPQVHVGARLYAGAFSTCLYAAGTRSRTPVDVSAMKANMLRRCTRLRMRCEHCSVQWTGTSAHRRPRSSSSTHCARN